MKSWMYRLAVGLAAAVVLLMEPECVLAAESRQEASSAGLSLRWYSGGPGGYSYSGGPGDPDGCYRSSGGPGVSGNYVSAGPGVSGTYVPTGPGASGASGGTVTTAGNHWCLDANGWWYQYANGTRPFSSFRQIDGVWYYFNSSGYLTVGWFEVNGKWYYCDSTGALYINARTPDGYYVGGDGAWIP